MDQVETSFNGQTSESFADHAETLRGHIRYELVRRNLQSIVTRKTLEVLDVGGGTGIDAIWLSEMGHSVTVLDPAEDQLSRAETRLSNLPLEQRQCIQLRKGTTADLLDENREGTYDLVLSHGVAMYVDEPAIFIQSLSSLVKSRHWVSLVEKGFYGARNGLLHEGKYDEAEQLDSSSKLINHMGRQVWAFKPEQIETMLFEAGIWLEVNYSGIRVGHDFDTRRVRDVDPVDLSRIVELEFEAGQRPDIKATAPMLHFIAS